MKKKLSNLEITSFVINPSNIKGGFPNADTADTRDGCNTGTCIDNMPMYTQVC